MKRAAAALALAGALVAAAVVARGQAFDLLSQNTLNMSTNASVNKQQYLRNNVVPLAPVILLQEIRGANPALSIAPIVPGTYAQFDSPSQGRGTRKEAYGFLVLTAGAGGFTPLQRTTGATVICYGGAAVAAFSRPPCGIMLDTAVNETWVLTYHAPFGTVGSRRLEIQEMGDVVGAFAAFGMGAMNATTTTHVVIGGDWNLPNNDVVFTTPPLTGGGLGSVAGLVVTHALQTSLTRAGALSSSYDHFFAGNPVVLANPRYYAPPGAVGFPAMSGLADTWANFRNNVSDHRAVYINVQ